MIGNIPFRAHATPHRIALGWLSAKRRREYHTALQAFKSLATNNPKYIKERFCLVGRGIELRRSGRRLPQTLYCNFLKPEKANLSFKKLATDLLNRMPLPPYLVNQVYKFKSALKQDLLERDKQDWEARIIREGIIV